MIEKYTCWDTCAKKDVNKKHCNKYNETIIDNHKVDKCVVGILEYIRKNKSNEVNSFIKCI